MDLLDTEARPAVPVIFSYYTCKGRFDIWAALILQDTAFARDTTKCPDIRYFSFLQLLQRARNRIFASVFYKHGGERQKINKTTTICTCSTSFFVPVFTAKFLPHTHRLAMIIRQMFWCHKLPPPVRKSSLRLDHLFGSFSSVYSIISPHFPNILFSCKNTWTKAGYRSQQQ